jgi:thiosulfate/3-mercaptopyruvate sulfurtransferase
MPWLINAAQLDKFRKNQKSLIILDASWFHPIDNRDARQEFINKHILDAQFFDVNSFTDPNNPIPNMLIHDEKIIGEKLSLAGIRNDYKIILYDNCETHSACRALWMFKLFGHNPHLLYILDGGLKAWENYGGKIDSSEPTISSKQYNVRLQKNYLRTLSQVKENLHTPQEQVVDVRHPVRFCGGPEPRTGIRSGHIPRSFCLPYFTLFEKDGTFRPLEKIRKQLSDVGISLNQPIITSCGSGMTAPILNFILDILSHEQHAVYDGSWSEWGAEELYAGETHLSERPIETCLEEIGPIPR